MYFVMISISDRENVSHIDTC